MSTKPSILFADEPLRDISIAEEQNMAELFQYIGKTCLIVVVTHNKQEAKQISDMVCFITGETVIEITKTTDFFKKPQTELGQEFLRTGSAWPSFDPCAITDVDQSKISPLSEQYIHPSDFYWIIPNLLAGMQKPGLMTNVKTDLQALKNLQVNVLVTLTEDPFDNELLETYEIESQHFPIIDMDIPIVSDTFNLCQKIVSYFDKQQSVVVHCKAGLGRTGTILACILAYQGKNPIKSIEQIRYINHAYIQTEEQFNFVSDFFDFCQLQST
jgi:atypical dual specificity phosphatase